MCSLGSDFFVVAYLVYTSTFLPRAIGILLAIDALNYVVGGFKQEGAAIQVAAAI